jgi:hypothetical protein
VENFHRIGLEKVRESDDVGFMTHNALSSVRLLSLLPIAVAVACQSPGGASPGTAVDPGVDEPTAVDTADCEDGAHLFTSLASSTTAVPTVPAVSWSTSVEAVAWVRFVGEDGVERETPLPEAKDEGRVTLRGLHSGEEWSAVVVLETDEGTYCSSPLEGQNGSLSSSLPVLSLSGEPLVDEWTTTPMFTLDGSHVTVIDGAGELVFAWKAEDQVWRSRFAQNGAGLVINQHAAGIWADGSILRLGWDGSVSTAVSHPGLHTDFVELSDGTLAGLVWDVRTFVDAEGDTRTILGDQLVEFSPSGEATVLWNVFDHFTPDLSIDWPIGIGALDDEAEDWSHANGLSYDEDSGEYYVSVPGIQSIVAVSRAARDQIWAVGYDYGNIETDARETILNPHSVYRTGDDQFLIFNRNSFDGGCSEASTIEIDFSQSKARTHSTYDGSQCLNVTYLGEAQPTDDDGMLLVWTTAGILERLDSEQASTWSVSAQLGAAFGFSHVTGSLYPTL